MNMATQGLIPGTKDWGISENPWVQKALPWLSQVDNPAIKQANAFEGQIQGVTTDPMQSMQMQSIPGQTAGPFGPTGYAQTGGSRQPTGGGNGGGGASDSEYQQLQKTSRNPSQESRYQELDRQYNQGAQQAPQEPTIDYDAMIAPALQALEEATGPAQSEYGANVASVEASAQKGKGQLQSSLAETQRAGEAQRTQLTGQTENAIEEARRQFSEMRQGLQARYGRSVGTGGFAESYLGGQTLRGISEKRAALTTAMQTIDDRLTQVKSVTDIALSDLEQQAEAQKLQVKSQLDSALQQIRTAKGQLLSQKAQLAQQAMQFYQQQVAQVNASNSAFKQQLMRDQMNAEQQLQLAREKGTKLISQFQLGKDETGKPIVINKTTGEVKSPQAGGALSQGQYSSSGYTLDENGNIKL